MASVAEWRLGFLQLHQLDSSLFFIRPMTNCGTFYCNTSILPKYFYTSAILFCKSADCVVSGAANGFGRGLGVHIHALDHGAWKSDYLQHFFNERSFDDSSTGILYWESKRHSKGYARGPAWLWTHLAAKGMIVNTSGSFWPLRQSLHHGVSIPPVLQPPWLLLLHRFLLRPAVVPDLKKGSSFSKQIIGCMPTQVSQFA